MICYCAILCHIIFIVFNTIFGQETVIETSKGKILGTCYITTRNTSGCKFLGIPYAEPPINELRYRQPVSKSSWTNVLNATTFRSSCYWNSSGTSQNAEEFEMSEDCLHINVLTNKKCIKNKNCAVIVFIHGGNFIYDTPVMFNTSFLIDNYLTENRSVLMVLPAFRLGSFGFLNISPFLKTTADKNVGLHDMIESLRWVKREIKNFGGDSTKVTIMGHSAGGSAVNYLTMSPLTKNLFSQAVILSGGTLFPLHYDKNSVASKTLALAAGCTTFSSNFTSVKNVEETLSCLRNVHPQKLVDIQRNLEDYSLEFSGPYLERENDGVLPKPVTQLRSNRWLRNVVLGTTTYEFMKAAYLIESSGQVNKQLLIEACSNILKQFDMQDSEKAMNACLLEYSEPSRAPYLYDDVETFAPTILNGEDVKRAGGEAFIFEFQYGNVGKAFDNFGKDKQQPRPGHIEVMVYLMGIHQGTFGKKDEIIRNKFSEIIVNFAKSGNPSPTGFIWQSLKLSFDNYFAVDFDKYLNFVGMKAHFHEDAVLFWNKTVFSQASTTMGGSSQRKKNDITAKVSGRTAPSVQLIKRRLPQILNQLNDFILASNNEKEPNPDKEITVWKTYFWLGITILSIMILMLLATCGLFAYNYRRRIRYEKII